MPKRKIPRCMSTQHPDNVNLPFFSESEILAGESEIKETYYVYSHLEIEEQMWDYEGKEVDNHVVEKLFSLYPRFFSENKLGEDLFLTLRVPNPKVEKNQAKILLETLETIPRSYDAANLFGSNVPPIWEIILPMCTSSSELELIYEYYKKIVIGKKDFRIGNLTIKEWLGDFLPEEISLIPLIEDKDSLLSSDKIIEEFIQKYKLEYLRVFLARSDPALNYGSLSAVLLNKLSLLKLHQLEEKLSVELFPIIGVGSAPFRGNLKPTNVYNCLREYPSVQTFTLQSSFKYDYPETVVRKGVEEIKETRRRSPLYVEEDKVNYIIQKVIPEYQRQIEALSQIITTLSKFVPSRRARKMHVGLFGYSRQMNKISLPRAIPFCCALYSIGIPPELLGLSALSEKDLDLVRNIYHAFDEDITDSTKYLCKENLERLPGGIGQKIEEMLQNFDCRPDSQYSIYAKEVMDILLSADKSNLAEAIIKTAWMRNFLG